MKIHWFSPLPPVRSGISVVTAALVQDLQRHAELTLWTDQAECDPALERRVRVVRFAAPHAPWPVLNDGDLTFYNLGNHPLHEGIWEISRRHSGIVILHDICLHHFFREVYLTVRHDRATYQGQVERYYGQNAGRNAALSCEGGYPVDLLAKQCPLTELGLENGLGVVVHTEAAWRKLKEEGTLPAAYVPLAIPESRAHRTQAAAARPAGPPFRLVMFGLFGANRRLDAFFEAWAGLPARALFRLDLCGEIFDRRPLSQLGRLGLEPLVTIHGFVPEDELHAKLDGAHLAVNLRYPTAGEASLSQLLIWQHGLPALVSQVGWYASCPEDAVLFVRPEHEIADIRAHLEAFLQSPERFAAMGQAGQRLLERHSPRRYADDIVRFGLAAREYAGRSAALRLAGRVSAELAAWAVDGAREAVAEAAAAQIGAFAGPAGQSRAAKTGA